MRERSGYEGQHASGAMRPGADFWRFGGGGLAEFRLDFWLDFNCSLTRPAPQAGCGGSNILPKSILPRAGMGERVNGAAVPGSKQIFLLDFVVSN